MNSRITGLGTFVPPRVVKNKDLEKLMDTSDEWIEQRTGIKERRWAESPMTTYGMGLTAAREALKQAGKQPSDVDAIVFATLSPDYNFPGCGVLLQRELCPEKTIPALDIRNQCSGFIYGLSVADAWIKAGMYKCVLLVGAEIHSTGLDKTPVGRDISVLFGDGAGAAVLEPCADGEGLLTTKIHSEGQYAEKLWLQKPSSSEYPNRSVRDVTITDRAWFPEMDGRFVFKNAIQRMCEVLNEATASIGKTIKDIDFVIAHQANLRINTMVLETLGIPASKTHNTIQKYGNTTAATIPLTFAEAVAEGKIKKGDLVAFVAFGSGFTWGATLLRW